MTPALNSITPRPYQVEGINSLIEGWKDPTVLHQLLSMATGCFRKETPILMADGRTLPVEKVRVGDQVMGTDGEPRTVSSLARGREQMYAIIPIKGAVHCVNEGHILTLEKTPKRSGLSPKIVDMTLRDYLKQSKTQKHILKLYRSDRVEFSGQMELLPLSPYFLGLYLGDGSATETKGRWTIQKAVSITTADAETVAEVERVAADFGLRVRVQPNAEGNKSSNYLIVGDKTGRRMNGRNAVSQIIKQLGVNVTSGEKFIPHAYKVASSANRLELLAGLIDTDGSLSDGGYDYISKSLTLANDVAFVARSLGLAAYVTPSVKSCQTGANGIYHRVSISGDCSIVPCRLPRKKAPPRLQKKSVLRTGFTVVKLGVEDYYGFSLLGPNGRFLLGDFTATHNTGKTVLFSAFAQMMVAQGHRVLILAHTDELIDQAIDKFTRCTGMRCGREKASSYASRFEKVVIGSVQTMMGDVRLASWPKNHFAYVVVDEAHRSLAAGYQKVLQHFVAGGAKVVGVTATADRGDKRALGEFFQRVAYDYGLLQAVRDGWLVRPIVKTMPIQIDLRGVKTKQTSDGADLDRAEVGHRLSPYLDSIAVAIKEQVGNEKVLLFLPSVETAQIMSAALNKAGVSANWVSGEKKICPDRTQRVADHKAGKFQALCNMAVLTEGYDDDTVKNIVCLRATKIRSLYCQIIGRGTRPIGNIVKRLNECANAHERLQVIKSSEKPHVRILDFLWLYEKHDLCTPASLVTKDERVAKLMDGKEGDLIAAEEQAERDLLKKLEDELKKKARKKSQVIDPLAFATDLSDVALATYEPETSRDADPVTPDQARILSQNGIALTRKEDGVEVPAVTCKGHARMLIGRILARHQRGLATARQLNFFAKIGVDASLWSKEEALRRQKEQIAEWGRRRAEAKAAKQEFTEPELPIEEEIPDFSELFGAPSLFVKEATHGRN